MSEVQHKGQTLSFLAIEKEVIAAVAITDKVKDTSVKAIETLKRQGIDVFMLTGDHESTTKEITRQVGIFQLRSEERRVGKECRSRWSP